MKTSLFLGLVSFWQAIFTSIIMGVVFGFLRYLTIFGSDSKFSFKFKTLLNYVVKGIVFSMLLSLASILHYPNNVLLFFLAGVIGGFFARELMEVAPSVVNTYLNNAAKKK